MSDQQDPVVADEQAVLARRVIVTLAAANFFLFFGAGAQQQYLVTYLGRLTDWDGVTRASVQAGVYFSMFIFRVANVWLLRGWSDRRQTIVGSFMYTGFCAAMAAFFFAPNYAFALAAALLWGWGGAAIWAGSSLQILAATDAARRGHGTGIGILYTTTHLGFWLGVIGLGWLYDALPDGMLYGLYVVAAVVTLVGKRHGERTTYSILEALGVRATIAHTGREYVDIAERLANDAAFRFTVKGDIAAGIATSVFTDMPAHTRNLESAYRSAIGTWTDG